jgi:hypothetical protein
VYITTKRYTSKEFYGVIIDTSTFKKSTADYRQYLIYKNTTMDNIDIDTTQIGAINVQFGIRSAALIGSVIVKTPIGPVNFYVIKADTPFLLCLTNIDNDSDTRSLSKVRPYRPIFKSYLTIIRITLSALKSTAYTTVSAIC